MGFIKRNKTFLEAHKLSFFEMTSGMAFEYFAKQKVDIAVIEVGLGGRLDSTNIITPIVSVITNIGLDHTQFLGETLDMIASEIAGIIKPDVPVVIGKTQSETTRVFKETAKRQHSKLYFADQLVKETFDSDLKGNYQQENIKTVFQTFQVLKTCGFSIVTKHIKDGLLKVKKHTGLQGRWQVLQEKPKIICDTAHNKDGLFFTMKQLQSENYKMLHMVFGVVNDKDLSTIAELLPVNAKYYFCKPDVPRGLEAEKLRDTLLTYGIKGIAYTSVFEALETAKQSANKYDVIYIGGSTFVVAEII